MAESMRLYWLGNAAKAFVVRDLLNRASGQDITVLDHGCGRAESWPEVLREHPNIRLLGWDPNVESAEAAKINLAGLNAEVSVARFPQGARADYIVSFSVLEHVLRKDAYMALAGGALRPGGVFYLNYDDGHFRYSFDPDRRDQWRVNFGRMRQNGWARLKALTGETTGFQRRVPRHEADALVARHGFRVEADLYQNLAAFKQLQKLIPTSQAAAFTEFWVDVEERLNRDFSVRLPSPVRGDDAALWQMAASRTLLLRR